MNIHIKIIYHINNKVNSGLENLDLYFNVLGINDLIY